MRMASWLGVAVTAAWALSGAWGIGCASGGSNTTQGVGGGPSGTTTSASTTASSGGATGSSSTSSSTGTGTGGATSSTTSGSGGGTGGAGGTVNPGLSLGSDCTVGSDCASQLCEPVVVDSTPVCVTPCTQQSDCGTTPAYFCEPVTAGSTSGYCIPHSPADCLSCKQDSDCGSLSEVCFQAPGDNALSCNVDCSIAGASACPPDYTCTPEMVNGAARQLCRPNLIATCLDAVGGYCDRLSVPQPCIRTNTAGNCVGERTCMQPSDRFSDCNAVAPQCLTDCSTQDPAGCMETYCASATSAPTDCGMCGMVCPGYMQHADNVTCNTSQMCTFSCQGENYDVNGNEADGCEVAAAEQGDHTQSAAANKGHASACDDGNNMEFSFTGHMPSDKRVHEDPAIAGFDATTGAAPNWYYLVPDSGLCSDDLVAQLCVQGSSAPSCYELTAISGVSSIMYSCQVDASGCCPADPNPQGSCPGNGDPGQPTFMGICKNQGNQWTSSTSAVYFEVQKTCSTATIEDPSYTVYGHF
jgi:hypothetical protein